MSVTHVSPGCALHLAVVPSKKGTEGTLCRVNKGTLCPAKAHGDQSSKRMRREKQRLLPCSARAGRAPGQVREHSLPWSMPRGTAVTRNWFIASNRCTYAVPEPRHSCSCYPEKPWRWSWGSCILSLLWSLKSCIFLHWLMRSNSLKEFSRSQGN